MDSICTEFIIKEERISTEDIQAGALTAFHYPDAMSVSRRASRDLRIADESLGSLILRSHEAREKN